jgi:hypothetical protein
MAAGAALSISALSTVVQADVTKRGSALGVVAEAFAWPGTTAWWLTLGGPFQTLPETPTGQAFAVITNAAIWLLLGWLLRVTARAVASRFKTQ